ncbi:MAG: hypothetical protein EOP48_05115 [Sphingobacteriales bacterium]|nr:MAG: hypothetical protein EOP48_05115 [Sphingobacteriales bacterium]
MPTSKYKIGQSVILLEVGTRLPAAKAVIIGYEPNNSAPYRINYKNNGDETIWTDDVTEDRLTTMLELGLQISQGK